MNFRQNQFSTPETLAKYCDVLLRKTGKSDDADSESLLAQSAVLFKYIDDKDVYQKFYARLLTKRLIYGSSTSLDAEATMISRLKVTFR
jgi:hypothetical protein